MNDELPMPSDLKLADPLPAQGTLVEPPSAKLLVRLFLIPFLIVALAVGVMFLLGRLAGGTPTMEEALRGLRNTSGGERTANMLLGPASKQRYLYAKSLVDHMKAGMSEAERISLTKELIEIIDRHTQPAEGDVRHALLLTLGRAWQIDPSKPEMNSAEAIESRQRAAEALLRYSADANLRTRIAAILAMGFWAGRGESAAFVPVLIVTLDRSTEDLDVRLASAAMLGPLGDANNGRIIDSLNRALRDTDPRNVELVWSAAVSLAQLGQTEVADTILKLLDRTELAKQEFLDRESDPKNPVFRKLTDQEQQRILINTMIGVRNFKVDAVQARLRDIAQSDSSQRVRAAARELLADPARK